MTKKKFHGSRKRKDLWAQGELKGNRFALWRDEQAYQEPNAAPVRMECLTGGCVRGRSREPLVGHRFGARQR
jgi:hypothetical protein